MDFFTEQLVKQTLEGKRLAIVLGSFAAALGICAVALLWLPVLLIPIALLLGFGLYWIAGSQNWEAEYIVTNGDIDIDRIVARRSRKTIVRVRGDKIDQLLPIAQVPSFKSFDRVVMASSSRSSATWFFTYQSPKSGKTLVCFEPNEAVLEGLKQGLRSSVLLETRRAEHE